MKTIELPTEANPAVLLMGDSLTVLRQLPDECVQTCITSPPYWGLRDYSICDCSIKRHGSTSFLSMDGAQRNGDGSGQCTPNDARCRKEPDPSCAKCKGTGRIPGLDSQIGLEPSPESYVARMVEVFGEVKRVLRGDGTLWLNLGDNYNAYNGGAGPSSSLSKGTQTHARPRLQSGYGLRTKGLKPKDLVGIPWRVAFALQTDGWYLRSDIIWSKPNPMPESVTDRPTKAHEYVFLLSKRARYYYDHESIKEKANLANFRDCPVARRQVPPGQSTDTGFQNGRHYTTRNRRSVWSITTVAYPDAHFATFPPALVEPMILAGAPRSAVVLDPFAGTATVGQVAICKGRRFIGIELNPEYVKLANKRLAEPLGVGGLFDPNLAPERSLFEMKHNAG